jgi:hypothetical protein
MGRGSRCRLFFWCRFRSRTPGFAVAPNARSCAQTCLAAQSQKNKDGLIDALYIFGIKMPDAVSEFIFWHCGDLINHESRKSVEAVAFVRCNRNPKQRRLSWIGCHDADRDGFCGIEAVIL